MAQDHNSIYSIVERLRVLEEGLTPTNVKHGLNRQQRSVNQLSATFKPRSVSVLTAKSDPKHPMAGKFVGDDVENTDPPLEETITSEDVLDRVKLSLADYLENLSDKIKQDTDLKDKKPEDTDLKKKQIKDRDLVPKPAEESADSTMVKTVTNECGTWNIQQESASSFAIHHGNRRLPSRFKSLDEAEMALNLFNLRRNRQHQNKDYIDEA